MTHEDALAAAKGIALGIVVSLFIWGPMVWLALR
jgi:hypothetical protein